MSLLNNKIENKYETIELKDFKVFELSDYGKISGHYKNQDSFIIRKIKEIAKLNNLKYLKMWLSLFDIDGYFPLDNNIKYIEPIEPIEIIVEFNKGKIVSVYKIIESSGKLIKIDNDIILGVNRYLFNGPFISSNRNDCINNYNKQIYHVINYLNDLVNKKKQQIENLNKMIIEAENNFIGTDLVAETLRN